MFELFLVMMAITSPLIMAIFVRSYFKYKTEVNEKLQALQQEHDSFATDTTQEKLDILVERMIALEGMVASHNIGRQ